MMALQPAAVHKITARLVAEVGLGHVGLVMGLEVSRLARSSLDWHHLLAHLHHDGNPYPR